jgi:hypothetical protein
MSVATAPLNRKLAVLAARVGDLRYLARKAVALR